jgi:hypothetical protein
MVLRRNIWFAGLTLHEFFPYYAVLQKRNLDKKLILKVHG